MSARPEWLRDGAPLEDSRAVAYGRLAWAVANLLMSIGAQAPQWVAGYLETKADDLRARWREAPVGWPT